MKRNEEGRLLEFGEFPELETDRLRLRRITLEDLEFYLNHFSRPEMIVGSGFPAPEGIDGAREEILSYCVAAFTENRGVRWGIELKGSPGLIGTLGFYNWVKEGGWRTETGYDLNSAFWGKGIMREAMSATIQYAFDEMRVNRIEAMVLPHNQRSIGLVQRLGFVQEGVLRDHGFVDGRFIDDILFALLARDWNPCMSDPTCASGRPQKV